MATVEELRLEIKAEVADAVSKLKQVERQSRETGSGLGSLGKTFASLRDVMQGPIAAAKMVVDGMQAVVRIGKELYNEYAEAERGQIVFAQAMKDSGKISADGASRLREYAEELQQLTGIDADNTQAIMGNLAAMGKSESQIKDLIEAASNYAAATRIDLDTAVKQLNSTLQGNVGMLGRQNLAIKSLTSEQLKNGDAIKIINEQYKGMAETVGKSAMGAAERLNANVGDLKEALGEVVAYKFGPLIENMVNAAKEAADKIKANTNIGKVLAGDTTEIENVRQAMIDIQNEINNLDERTFTKYYQYQDAKKALEEAYAKLKGIHSTQLAIATAAEKERDALQKAAEAEESKRKAQEKAAAEAAKIEERNRINGAARLETWHAMQTAGEGYFAWLTAQEDEAQKKQAENDRARLATWAILNEMGRGQISSSIEPGAGVPVPTEQDAGAWDIYIQKLQEVQTEQEKMVELAKILGDAMASAFAGIGEALVSGESGWKAFGKAAIGAIAAILEGISAQLAAQAAAALVNSIMGKVWEGMAIGPALAGAAAAGIAAGAIRAIPMAEGGSGVVTKPTLFLAGEAGPEPFAFGGAHNKRGMGNTYITVQGSLIRERELSQYISAAAYD